MTQAYTSPDTPRKVVDAAYRMLQDMGYTLIPSGRALTIDRSKACVHHTTTDAAFYAARAHLILGNIAIAEQFRDLAIETYRTLFGTLHGFGDRYGVPVG